MFLRGLLHAAILCFEPQAKMLSPKILTALSVSNIGFTTVRLEPGHRAQTARPNKS